MMLGMKARVEKMMKVDSSRGGRRRCGELGLFKAVVV